MSENFLHGLEVLEVSSDTRPIDQVSSSMIGVVGTALNSTGAIKASLILNDSLRLDAKLSGISGNSISIEVGVPASNSSTLDISVKGMAITVNLATISCNETSQIDYWDNFI